ncbi:FKBP-type peptidyl-prolyl cis-trans isomerase [Chitinophaga sedimenti]|uniref:FKBP-type peptidyl-prolyl cis-trans isomerase n=1 Tax=Chitinophaga sedimenti TaxID=2033606 RepID=UPI002002A709|nr:FKBP-type peptidyl-prolyl cis-trans isomerase [Chitinophaga sedimenti]MCK7555021.1 FKBP-type peptidyl-prolyl cis-trans isomerase [Chitinophaga sedimenti]
MIASKGRVVTITYIIKDGQGNLLDNNDEQPVSYVQGANKLLPGLERALENKQAGDAVVVKLQPEEAFGQRVDNLIRTLRLQDLEIGDTPLEPGEIITLGEEEGGWIVTAIEDDTVYLDGNDPWAGKTLHISANVLAVREGSQREISKGEVE